eukprot:TRINITY_DN32484_c0_g1_i1.p1 TRINITY_DN32484_c0_g1~~TRINITY_DN32484_c0_g1_i1.p1  ORF type:complete len:295 (+),score=57.11 TRINITY_DN32484_c0_g1_i1:244-1128(+)
MHRERRSAGASGGAGSKGESLMASRGEGGKSEKASGLGNKGGALAGREKDKETVAVASTSAGRNRVPAVAYDKAKFADEAEDSESGSEASDVSGASDEAEDTSWISWFCSLKGNEFFCQVDEEFIQDDFNLSGLSGQVPYYEYALDLILDVESPNDDMLTEEQHEMVESAAEMLYGLIHVRYILTGRGLAAMLEKCRGTVDFGRCPRVFCAGQPCLPMGQSDIPRSSTVKIYCPKCEDIFYPRSKYQGNVDGAYFGTTFPHLFLMTYPFIKPAKPMQGYVPRIFGFKLHKDSGQ